MWILLNHLANVFHVYIIQKFHAVSTFWILIHVNCQSISCDIEQYKAFELLSIIFIPFFALAYSSTNFSCFSYDLQLLTKSMCTTAFLCMCVVNFILSLFYTFFWIIVQFFNQSINWLCPSFAGWFCCSLIKCRWCECFKIILSAKYTLLDLIHSMLIAICESKVENNIVVSACAIVSLWMMFKKVIYCWLML